MSLRHVSTQIFHFQGENVPNINAATLDVIDRLGKLRYSHFISSTYFTSWHTHTHTHTNIRTHTHTEGGIFMPKHVAESLYTYCVVTWL
jgi:hypothetical protein